MISDISNDTEDVEVSYMLMSIPLLYIDVFLHLISWGVFFLDNPFTVQDLTVFYSLFLKESEQELEDEVDILMSSDIMAAQMSTKSITFSRAQSGWLFREDKTVNTFISFLLHCLVIFISQNKYTKSYLSKSQNLLVLSKLVHTF